MITNEQLINALNDGTLEVSDSSVLVFLPTDIYNALMTLLSTANEVNDNDNT